MEITHLAMIALAVLAYGLLSARAERSVVSAPMIFLAFGVVGGESGLGILDIQVSHDALRLIAEMTLIIVLFTDAARIDFRLLRHDHDLPIRLLAIGLPLTIVLGALVAFYVFDGLSPWEAALVAAILAPTDAALGQAVVASEKVPIRIRQALNVESGLNDGISLPVILLLLALVATGGQEVDAGYWVQFTTRQVLLGPAAGIVIGLAGGWLIDTSHRKGLIEETYIGIAMVALALIVYAGAEAIHGNGFMAVFCAGLTVGNTTRHLCTHVYEFGESEGQLLALVTFLLFGSTMVPGAFQRLTMNSVVFAILALTVVRMLPVTVSVLGQRLRPATHLFLGWFGPRGLASILFALLLVDGAHVPHAEMLMDAVVVTVVFSVVLHGMTAWPGSEIYGRLSSLKTELQPVRPLPTRFAFVWRPRRK